MFIQPWDAALDVSEWREWLAGTDRFGVLGVNNLDPDHAPLVLPIHFTAHFPDEDADQGDTRRGELFMHLARPNPVWPHLERATEVRLTVIGDYAFIPTYWRADADVPDEYGVPTSYYAAVDFTCRPTIVDDPEDKAELLSIQLADFQPEGGHAVVAPGEPPYGRLLSGIRGIRLEVLHVDAKFKYDDHKPVAHRERVIGRLQEREHGLDREVSAQQRRRLDAIGDWQTHRTEA